MEVEELQAILEAKDSLTEQEEEEIIYAEEETEQLEEIEEQAEEIIEIIEEIEMIEGEDDGRPDDDDEENIQKIESHINEHQSQLLETQGEESQDENVERSDENAKHQNVLTYDAEQDWEEEEADQMDPLQINKKANQKARPTMNGNQVSNGTVEEETFQIPRTDSDDYDRTMKIPRQDEDSNPHEIVKSTDNDLIYTVLGSKKQSAEEKIASARYIKMERLAEDTIPVEGTIYYEGDDMGTLYVAHTLNEGEQYHFEGEEGIQQEEHQQMEQQEQWDDSNQIIMAEQGQEEENGQDQIFLHEDEDGQLFFKDENGQMQPVYLTEDGNYAIASNSSDEQDGHDTRNRKLNDSISEMEAISRQPLSPVPSQIEDNEDSTVTISLIISEDENGLKRTQVIIPTNDALKCEICQKSFKTQFQLLRHNRLKHAREEDITVRNFPCDLCPKRFPDQNSLAKHRKTHTGDRPFQCLECHEQFPSANVLRRHMSEHNPDSKPLPCIYCGRRFIDKPTLQKHERSHLAAEQPEGYSCDICHKTFLNATDLSLHKKNHDPDKKFDCEVCGREFNRLNNLQRHMLVHQQVRDKPGKKKSANSENEGLSSQGQNQEILSCDVCGITYKFMSSLTRHMVTSHMNPEKLRQQAEEQRRKRENNYKRYLENRKMYETHIPSYNKRICRGGVSSDPDDDLA